MIIEEEEVEGEMIEGMIVEVIREEVDVVVAPAEADVVKCGVGEEEEDETWAVVGVAIWDVEGAVVVEVQDRATVEGLVALQCLATGVVGMK